MDWKEFFRPTRWKLLLTSLIYLVSPGMSLAMCFPSGTCSFWTPFAGFQYIWLLFYTVIQDLTRAGRVNIYEVILFLFLIISTFIISYLVSCFILAKNIKKIWKIIILVSILLIILLLLLIPYIISTGVFEPKPDFDLPDSFITMKGPILAVKSEYCHYGSLKSEHLVTKEDCGHTKIAKFHDKETGEWLTFGNITECIRIPLWFDDKELGLDLYRKVRCDGQRWKVYCQIKMDNKIIIEGCLGHEIINFKDIPVDISNSHTFTVCCKADETREEFDVCKNFTMEKIC